MKTLLRFFAIILLILGILVLSLFLTGNQYLLKGVWATYLHGETSATINDARFFDTRNIAAGTPTEWQLAEDYNQRKLSDTLQATLEKTESVAFLIIKNDKIVIEKYWDGYSDTSHSNSFSMAKSITTMLVQIAIQKGLIDSWDDPVIKYLPGIQGPYRRDLKLKDLSMMAAGLQWDEGYSSPFGITAQAYYSSDVESLLYEKVPVVNQPGKEFNYQSGAPQLLGLVLSKATGKSVSEFASDELWKPLGASENAFWHLDRKNGNELTYCCFNSNALDFARFGKLLEHYGNWNGTQLLDSTFVATASSPGRVNHYGWSFWIDDRHLTKVYYMRGILGQYVIVIPEKDLVICRLGKERLPNIGNHPADFKVIVEETLKYFGS